MEQYGCIIEKLFQLARKAPIAQAVGFSSLLCCLFLSLFLVLGGRWEWGDSFPGLK